MMIYTFMAFFAFLVQTCEMALAQCKTTESVYGWYLRNHAISTHPATEPIDCSIMCDKDHKCKSWNFWLDDKKCELNDADRFTQPKDYQERSTVVYSDILDSASKVKSCAEVKQRDPRAPSGYYWINIANKTVQVYCDMEKFGGGWTLVVSISSESSDHLLRGEHNCSNSKLCVPFSNASIPARKFSDEDISEIAATEGTFRLEDWTASGDAVFYKIPKGVDHFDSSCSRGSCPRIIISYSFPYVWESNCKCLMAMTTTNAA